MYALGIDLGTTYTAAATWRDGRVEIASLGSRGAVVPSVVLLRDDETFLTGETANRRALTEPDRVAREFKRRLGDPTPLLLGGVPYAAEGLMARLLRWVVDEVSEREGGEPETICVSHPANWGPYKLDLLQQAVRRANLDQPVSYTTEPAAAATFYTQGRPVPAGSVVAVYDLGGGTFDAAVLRKTETGFELLGRPEGIERLGGIDFDAAVFSHVSRAIGDKLEELDDGDPSAVAAVARLREECVEAKEALSTDTDVSIPVLLPNLNTEVRLTRSEYEAMVRPVLHESIEALRRALRSAEVEPEDLHAVLLVGGSSRMPIVAQLVGAELGRPVAVDAHPKHAIALGAAWVASGVAPAAVEATAESRAAVAGAESSGTQDGVDTATDVPGRLGAAAAGAVAGGAAVVAGSAADAQPLSPARNEPSSAVAGGAAVAAGSAADAQPLSHAQNEPPSTVTADASAPDTSADLPSAARQDGAAVETAPTAGRFDERPGERTMMMSTAGAVGSDTGSGRPEGQPSAFTGGGRGGGRGPQTPLLLAGAVAAIALIALGGWWIFGPDGDDGNAQTGEQQEEGEQQGQGEQQDQGKEQQQGEDEGEEQQQEPQVPADEQCTEGIMANDRWVCITSASIADGELVIEYEAEWAGGTPDIDGGFHVHFYGTDESGTNPPASIQGTHAEGGNWYVEDQNPSVHAVDTNQGAAIGDAPKVCARIADGGHALVPDTEGEYNTGNCWPITRSD